MAQYMRYAGQVVEIFAWTPAGQPVPCLRAQVIGETVGDHAFVDERAMSWDGENWQALLWKDFAVWKKVGPAPKRRASDVEPPVAHRGNRAVGDGEVEVELRVPAE